MNKNTKIIIGVIIVIIVIGVAWYAVSKQQKEQGMIKIGAILPLSGDSAFLGKSEINGINLAIDDFNSKSKNKVQLITEDSQANPTQAVNAVNKLKDLDKVKIIISSLTPVSSAIVPITAKENILTFLISVLSPSLAKQSEYVFKFYPDMTIVAKNMAEYLNSQNYKKTALVIYNVEAGEIFIQQFKNFYKGDISNLERFDRTASDFRTIITKIKATQNLESIIFIGYPQNDVIFLNQLVELNLRLPTLLQFANYPAINKGAKESLAALEPISSWYTFDELKNKDFVTIYQNKFGEVPDAEAAYSYDAAKIILDSLVGCNFSTSCVINYLKENKFSGLVADDIRFDNDGNSILPVEFIKYNRVDSNWKLFNF